MGDRLRIRAVDTRNLERDLAALCDIFNDAWANNWMFVPFTHEEFIRVGKEMLLVISLIALLISLLLPAIQKSRSSARAAVCLVNEVG